MRWVWSPNAVVIDYFLKVVTPKGYVAQVVCDARGPKPPHFGHLVRVWGEDLRLSDVQLFFFWFDGFDDALFAPMFFNQSSNLGLVYLMCRILGHIRHIKYILQVIQWAQCVRS